jgi:hypothetical protein
VDSDELHICTRSVFPFYWDAQELHSTEAREHEHTLPKYVAVHQIKYRSYVGMHVDHVVLILAPEVTGPPEVSVKRLDPGQVRLFHHPAVDKRAQ